MISMFFAGLFVTIAIAVFVLAHMLLMHAIFIGPPQENATPRRETRAADVSGAMTA